MERSDERSKESILSNIPISRLTGEFNINHIIHVDQESVKPSDKKVPSEFDPSEENPLNEINKIIEQ
jgi:hypothetical protein